MSFLFDQFGGILLGVSFVLLAIKFITRKFSDYKPACSANGKPLKVPPCLPWLPIVGSLPFLGRLEQLGARFTEESKRLGSVFAFYASGEYTVVLNGVQTIREAYIKKSVHFADRKPLVIDQQYGNPNSKGMTLTPYTDDYIKYRHTSLSLLKDLGFGTRLIEPRINSELDRLVTSISELNGNPFDPTDLFFKCVNGIITGFAFGRDFDFANKPLEEEVKTFSSVSMAAFAPELNFFPVLRFLPKYSRIIKEFTSSGRILMELLDVYIKEAIASESESFVKSYVNTLGPDCDMEQLKFTIRDFFLGGSETTLTTLRWIVVFLASRPDWQRCIQEQIDEELGSRDMSLTDMSKLTIVEATILEVMRIRTLVPLSVPRNTLCDTEVNGFSIPKNTTVLANLYGTHMDADVWPNPEEFRPERFLDEKKRLICKENVTSFSFGKRSCLGEVLARQEMFFMTTRLLQFFDIRPPEGYDCITVSEEATVVIRPTAFEARFIPRIVS